MSTKKIIQFANTTETSPDPVETTSKLRFRDLILKPELRERAVKWDNGANWVRILPPIQGSSYQWMMRIETIQAPDGQGDRLPSFCHPKSFERGARSPFDDAYAWFKDHGKEHLHHREKNPNGFKLTTKSQGACWLIYSSKEPGERLGIFVASLYDGSWGGGPGLAYRIWSEANQIDKEPGSPTFEQKVYGDITAPKAGRLVLIEKKKPESGSGDRYASYIVRVGKAAAPVDKYTEMLSDEEFNILTPLEEAFYRPSTQEQHEILRDYIGKGYYQKIFGDGSATGLPSEQAEPVQTEEEAPTNSGSPEPAEPAEPESSPAEPSIPSEPAEPTPTPEPKRVEEAPKKEVTPAAEETKEFFAIRDISKKIETKEGTIEILKEFDRVQPKHRSVVLEVAKDLEIDLTPYNIGK